MDKIILIFLAFLVIAVSFLFYKINEFFEKLYNKLLYNQKTFLENLKTKTGEIYEEKVKVSGQVIEIKEFIPEKKKPEKIETPIESINPPKVPIIKPNKKEKKFLTCKTTKSDFKKNEIYQILKKANKPISSSEIDKALPVIKYKNYTCDTLRNGYRSGKLKREGKSGKYKYSLPIKVEQIKYPIEKKKVSSLTFDEIIKKKRVRFGYTKEIFDVLGKHKKWLSTKDISRAIEYDGKDSIGSILNKIHKSGRIERNGTPHKYKYRYLDPLMDLENETKKEKLKEPREASKRWSHGKIEPNPKCDTEERPGKVKLEIPGSKTMWLTQEQALEYTRKNNKE